MKVAIFEGAGKPLALRVVDDPAPSVGEVVIKVGRCGICGTDLHMTSGHSTDFPIGSVLGHEYAGEVVAVGAGVENLKNGDRIAAMPATGCGQCAECVAGYPLACMQMEGRIGGFGQYLRASAAGSVKLPQALSMADGALVEPLAVGLHGVAMAALVPGARVLVLGAGSVGLAAIFWARRLGAGRIVASARSTRRAAMAAIMGADGFVALGDGDIEAIHEALGGPPDVVLECAGAVGMLARAIDCVRAGGRVVSMGFCTSPDPILPSTATWKRISVAFSFGYTLSEFQFTTDTLDAGHVQPRHMITETVSLEALPAAFEVLREGGRQTKMHVDPWAA